MTVNSSRLVRTASLCALLTPIAGAAGADICDVSRAGVPDFDQKRESAPGIVGLPNDGRMYCVPTSWVDWLGFMANNGYPEAIGASASVYGPQQWEGPDPAMTRYNLIGGAISDMGDLMDTDPYDGTFNALGGLIDYLEDALPNDYFTASRNKGATFSGVTFRPTPKDMAEVMAVGGLVTLHIGWYEDWGTHYERTGGHQVALRSVSDACSALPQLGYRDPSSGDSKTEQSAFSTRYTECTPVTALFSKEDDPDTYLAFAHRLETYGGDTKGFIDGCIMMWPNFGAGIDTTIGKVKLVRPRFWTRELLPAVDQLDFSSLTGGVASAIELHPYLAHAAVITEAAGGKPGMLLDLNMADGSVRKVLEFLGDPGPMTFGRHGQAVVCDGSVLKAIEWADGSVLKARPVDHPIDQLVYDDALDEVLALSIKNRRLLSLPEDLSGVNDRALPEAVQPLDHASMAINPFDNSLHISRGDGSVHEIIRSGAGPLVSISWLLPAVGPDVRCLQFTEKSDALVLDGGVLQEFTPVESGRYVVSDRTGLKGHEFGGPFRLPRSRDSFDTDEIRSIDVLPPEDGHEEPADCYADYVPDGYVNGDDFDRFVEDFAAGILKADINYDGFVNGDDFDSFVARFDDGC